MTARDIRGRGLLCDFRLDDGIAGGARVAFGLLCERNLFGFALCLRSFEWQQFCVL